MDGNFSRCPWPKSDEEIAYHDHEWCKILHDDKKIFEILILEGMQAGLSWDIVLKKRERMGEVFSDFEPEKIASYDEEKIDSLIKEEGIIRNRLKLSSMVKNARSFLKVQEEFSSFDSYIWSFTDYEQIDHELISMEEMPSRDEISDLMSKDLKKRGFKFVGPKICYSFMQGIGMVNDHLVSCDFR